MGEPLSSIPDVFLEDVAGESLWLSKADCPVVLVFLRYLGCTVCRESLRMLAEKYLSIISTGAELWVVVPSAPEVAKQYVIDHKLPFSLVADPTRSLYKEYQVEEDKVLLDTLRHISSQQLLSVGKLLVQHGHGLPEGSERQKMAFFIFTDDQKLHYTYRASSILESLPIEDLMRAVESLPPRRVMGNL
jgi:peroxiredoxin